MQEIYDIIIVGGGPGGYTAALYAARAGLKTLVLEGIAAGGQLGQTHWIDNYPGFPEGIDGFTLAQQMLAQAQRFGAETKYQQVLSVDLNAQPKKVKTAKGEYFSKALILATGAKPRPLGLPGEAELTGKGVGYCAACDGMFYKGKTVVVVGGGNTAAGDALLLSRVAEKVILVHRRDSLRATKVYHQALLDAPNVQILWNSKVTALHGQDKLSGVTVENLLTGEESHLDCQGLFVSVGRLPNSSLVQGQLVLDEQGYIPTDAYTQTAVAGVFAVGDVRNTPLRQVVTAVADGALAVHQAEIYLTGMEKLKKYEQTPRYTLCRGTVCDIMSKIIEKRCRRESVFSLFLWCWYGAGIFSVYSGAFCPNYLVDRDDPADLAFSQALAGLEA